MSTYKQRKTPGVYVTELDAFPHSIVGVQTAVPIFIGYTEKAEISGKPVFNKAVKLNSLVDYETVFGRGYRKEFKVEAVADQKDISAGKYDLKVMSYAERSEGGYEEAGEKYYKLAEVSATAFNLFDSMRLFYANGGGPCYVVSVNSYVSDGNPNTISAEELSTGLAVAGDQVGPTMTVIPDAVLIAPDKTSEPLISAGFQKIARGMLDQALALQDRLAILDVYASNLANHGTETPTLSDVIDQFRLDVGEVGLSYGAAYFPFVHASVMDPNEIDYRNISNLTGTPSLHEILSWQNITLNYGDLTKDEGSRRYQALQVDIDKLNSPPTLEPEIVKLANNLTAGLPLMGDIDRVLLAKQSMLPASGAMAGLYTANDNSVGVWNAPANVVVNSTVSLTYKLKGDEQDDLNMPVDGKSIAAIREFVGRGPVVWGARTLDGNSPDYRYIQVRRTLIYIEQSVKTALNQFVFKANDGKTWTTVVAMVSGFLNGLWSQGGLMGNSASEAYSVECGLGSTMTGQDILDGYMIVQIQLQMIRPAEFIELTFKQKMEGVATS